MHDTQYHVLSQVQQWLTQGCCVWLATVVDTYGSSPRPPGSLWAWSADAGMAGSLSGGCVEQDLIERLRTGAIQPDALNSHTLLPLRFGASAEEQSRYQLPCGGHLDILLERLTPADLETVQQMLDWLDQRVPFVRILRAGQPAQLSADIRHPQPHSASSSDSGSVFVQRCYPQWQLLLVGAGEVARHLAALAQPAGFAVTLCDHREDFLQGFAAPGATVIQAMPDELIASRFNDEYSAIVALAHDPRLDDLAMIEALDSRAFYIGAMGSLLTSEKRRQRLQSLAISNDQLQRLQAPVGLDIRSKTPYEIAISIVAHLIRMRNAQH
jgi:xanthine dehydrogenase accessory factor